MNKIFLCICLITSFISNHLLAQDKLEIEKRVKQKEVPVAAAAFMADVNTDAKIKWYSEESTNHKSIEAKFTRGKSDYSVEFDPLGNMEDVEVLVDWQDLAAATRAAFSAQLDQDCDKHSIEKVQQQFTGNSSDLLIVINTGTISEQLTVHYEIVVKCHRDEQTDLYEYLLNDAGQPQRVSKIIPRNSSHLEY
jgi:hypothetical protein